MGVTPDVRDLADVSKLLAVVEALNPLQRFNLMPAALAQWGGGPFASEVVPRDPPEPSWVWCDFNDFVLVAFSGILTAQDGLNAFVSTLQPLSSGPTWRANQAVLGSAEIALTRVLQRIGRLARNWVTVGHSYGGCLAQAFAVLVLDQQLAATAQVLTLGSPRPGDDGFARRLAVSTARRFFNDNDPVPHFPPHLAEAPVATVAVGFQVASRWAQYVQPAGGVQLSSAGEVTAREVSSSFLPIRDAQLIGWAVSDQGFFATGHRLAIYRQRIDKALSLVPPVPGVPLIGSRGEPLSPLTDSAFNAATAGVAGEAGSLEGREVRLTGYIPPLFRASVARIGATYQVEWMGKLIVTGTNRSNARSIAKYLNAFLRRLQTAASADHTEFNNALANYWTVCSAVGIGFNPVLVVT